MVVYETKRAMQKLSQPRPGSGNTCLSSTLPISTKFTCLVSAKSGLVGDSIKLYGLV